MDQQETRSKNYFFYGLLLLAVCMISSGALSFVANLTAPAIEKTSLENLNRLQKEVLPEAESFVEISGGIREGVAGKDKIPVGKVVVASERGYGGDITVIVGVSQKDSRITGVKILSHKETPGLGTKALTPDFLKQFIFKKPDEIKLKKDYPDGKIDGITGATISSRAVTKAVASAVLKAVSIGGQNTDGVTSATPPGNRRIKVSTATK